MLLKPNKLKIGDKVSGKPGTGYTNIVNDTVIGFHPTPNSEDQLNPILKKAGEIAESWLVVSKTFGKYTKDYILKNQMAIRIRTKKEYEYCKKVFGIIDPWYDSNYYFRFQDFDGFTFSHGSSESKYTGHDSVTAKTFMKHNGPLKTKSKPKRKPVAKVTISKELDGYKIIKRYPGLPASDIGSIVRPGLYKAPSGAFVPGQVFDKSSPFYDASIVKEFFQPHYKEVPKWKKGDMIYIIRNSHRYPTHYDLATILGVPRDSPIYYNAIHTNVIKFEKYVIFSNCSKVLLGSWNGHYYAFDYSREDAIQSLRPATLEEYKDAVNESKNVVLFGQYKVHVNTTKTAVLIDGKEYSKKHVIAMQILLKEHSDTIKSVNVGCNGQYKLDLDTVTKITKLFTLKNKNQTNLNEDIQE